MGGPRGFLALSLLVAEGSRAPGTVVTAFGVWPLVGSRPPGDREPGTAGLACVSSGEGLDLCWVPASSDLLGGLWRIWIPCSVPGSSGSEGLGGD